jgi:hypothetical protein
MRSSASFLLVAVAVLMAAPASAQTPFGDGFDTAALKDYLEPSANAQGASVAPADGAEGKCLQLTHGAKGGFRFRQVPIEGEKKYKLSFRAKLVGDDVIERNSRIDVIQVAAGHLLPRCQVRFFDAGRKPLPGTPGATMISGKWSPYVIVFYAPPSAVSMQVVLNLPGSDCDVLVDDMNLESAPDEGAINCNPDLRYGSHAYTGWANLATGAMLVELPGGRFAMDTAYGSSTETFPLREPGTYRLYAKGTVRGGFHTVDLRLYNAGGELIKTRSLSASQDGVSSDFVLPEGTASGSLLVYNHMLEEVRVTRMGDKSKLAELDAARAAGEKKK